jgi:hypothetical protein
MRVVQKYFLARLKTKLWRRCLWIRESCWVGGIEFDLLLKFGFINRIEDLHFRPHVFISCYVNICFDLTYNCSIICFPCVHNTVIHAIITSFVIIVFHFFPLLSCTLLNFLKKFPFCLT